MHRLMIIVPLLLVATAQAMRGTTAGPFHYHWRDIGGNCVDDCNYNIYKCPCIHVNLPPR
jgi:hypothetical protein